MWEGQRITMPMTISHQQDFLELLFLALYQDGHLSTDEDEMLQTALNRLGFKLDEEKGPSVSRGFSAVREANSCEATKELFLKTRTDRLKEGGHAALTLEWLGKVLASDGLDGQELRFFERVEKMLFS